MRNAETNEMTVGFKPPPRGEDLPTSDGEPMDTPRHRDQMNLLIGTLSDAWRERDDFYVSGNMFIYFSELQEKRNDFRGPDVFVVMDTVRKERKSWVVWEEDGRTPDVVIELVSPTTEHVDRGDKMRIYAKLLHVAEYYLFDPFTAELEGYALEPSSRAYRKRAPDDRGRFHSAVTGLTLGVVPTRYNDVDAPLLRWIDADDRVLPTGTELARREAARAEKEAARAEEEAARAEREAARATEAQARIAELERRLAEKT